VLARIETQAPGPKRLVNDAHVIRVHAGPAATGSCGGFGRRVYVRGDIDVFPAGQSCTWIDDAPTTSLVIELPRTAFLTPPRPRHKFRDATMEHLAWAVASELEAGELRTRFRDGIARALVAHLGRIASLPPTEDDERAARFDEGRIRRIEQAIELGLGESLTIEHLARVVGLGPTHFKRVFRATFGTTVHAYVVRRRVSRARELLATATLSRAEIAARTGFADQSHMARWLRRIG
jgi:AraC family transcriptional regulator